MLRSCCLFFVALFPQLIHTPAHGQQQLLPVSQTPSFRHLTYTDGLLGNNASAITQDAKGFMWFGFGSGLQRYDGEKFLTYPFHPVFYLQPSVSATELTLFVNNDSRFQKFNQLNGTTSPLIPDSNAATVYTDKTGKQWRLCNRYEQAIAGSPNMRCGLAYLQWPDGRRWGVKFITDSHRQQTWVQGGESELLLLDEKSHRLYTPEQGDGTTLFDFLKPVGGRVRGIAMDAQYNLWIFTWVDVFLRYDTRGDKLYSYHIADVLKSAGKKTVTGSYVNDILCDRQGNTWIATSKAGLLRYNHQANQFDIIKADAKNSRGLHYSFDIRHLYQDRENNIWVATDEGISFFNPYYQPFTILRHDDDNSASLPADEITDVIETDGGNILVATWGGGVGVYNQQKQHIKNLSFGDMNRNRVWCFAKRANGVVAAGCQYGVLQLLQPDGSVKTWQPPALQASTIRHMVSDSAGNTWLGLHNGKIALWEKDALNVTVFNTANDVTQPVAGFITNLFVDSNGKVWLATLSGLKQFDPQTQLTTGPYQPVLVGVPPRLKPACFAIEELNDSLLLIGFETLGLCVFNRRTKSFSPITINNDSRPQSVYAIKKDSANTLWVSTGHEIFQWDVAGQKFLSSSPNRDLMNGLFYINRIYQLHSGEWVTFTQLEIIFFNRQQQKNTLDNLAPVTITGFRLFSKDYPVDSLLANGSNIHLAYNQNFFTVEFATLQYHNADVIKYQYRLKGLDDHWTAAGNRRSASYNALPPGAYVFEVKQEGGNRITAMPIVIQAAFWQTTFFQVAVCLLGAGLIAGFVWWRINTVKQRARLQQQVADTEMAALRAQMNPHFIFNCINSIDALIQRNDKYNATVYLNKFAKLIRNILDSSKQNTVPLTKDFETLRLYIELEQFRSEGKFTAAVTAKSELLQEDYRVPPLIVQPYVENAIQHGLRHRAGNDGRLVVEVARENGSLVFLIEDNGVGRSGADKDLAERSHYGLQMSSDRIKLFNEKENASVEITDLNENGEAKGTRVKVWLRVN